MNTLELAENIARAAHHGQLRKTGEPYITHPLMVKENVIKYYHEYFVSDLYLEDAQVVALLHDVSEDTSISEDAILNKFISNDCNLYYGNIYEALKVLNKKNHNNYLNYIIACKNNAISRVVKISDISHNLSDLKSGSLKDKYLLAKYLLQD